MDRSGSGIENRKDQPTFVIWIHMESGDVDQSLEFVARSYGNECDGRSRYDYFFLGQDKAELPGRNGEALALCQLGLGLVTRIVGFASRRHIDFGTNPQTIGSAINALRLV